jgi:hypothetical protein
MNEQFRIEALIVILPLQFRLRGVAVSDKMMEILLTVDVILS